MLSGLVGGLIIAWILSLFDFHKMFKKAILEIFDKEVSTDFYYVFFALIGLIGSFI